MPRYNAKPEELSQLLADAKGPLANIAQKSRAFGQLAQLIQHICPDLPADSFRLANISHDNIVIEAKSPVWGQRLQFEKNKILSAITELPNSTIKHITVKVIPFGFHKQEISDVDKPQKSMSSTTAKHLSQVAEMAPTSLKEKLLKLAKHANKNK